MSFWGTLYQEDLPPRAKTVYTMIHCYISYYNNRRVQRNLGILTPLEKFNLAFAA